MMLHCTLVPAPGSALPSGPLELAVEVPAECPGADLQAAVGRRYGTGELTVDRVPLTALKVGEVPLVQGAVLVDGAASPPARHSAPLALAVHGGPGAGLVFPLRRGRSRIGRSGTEVVIPDAELSREHALLEVTDSAVTLLDLGSANGVRVDGRRERAATVSTDSLIRCGGSTMSIVFGSTLHPGVPGAAGSDVSAPLPVGNPVPQSNGAAQLVSAVLPLGLGAGLAFLTGMWIFLAFTAVSAVSVLVPVLAGRKQRRALAAAVAAAAREDGERRRRAAPSAAELSLGLTSVPPGPPEASAPAAGPVWLRLGQAEQSANIRLEPPAPGWRPPLLALVPVTLDPATAVTAIRGPETAVAGLVRSMVLQLGGYPAARRTRILIHGPTPPILAARFLPGAILSGQDAATRKFLATGPGRDYERGVLIIAAAPGTAGLCSAAVSRGWQVLDCADAPDSGTVPGAALVLNARTARLSRAGCTQEFTPDLVPVSVFDRNCRVLGARASSAAAPAGIPASCSLGGLLPRSDADISLRWAASARAPGLPAPVGFGSAGPLRLDLQADGPHFLVAGTTGSGKSEFLRTLAVGLAALHSPWRINLLLVDFKGGSGLRPLAGLAHCVGLLTDLDVDEVARTLVSLRAEIRRRETLLASRRAPDLAAYEAQDPPGPGLPHLVIVIDEFRMLIDEAPEALAELMRISAIGRSLGIHLVMATQRPQGAISADIRANVTSRIAFRVQSELESLDIINSRLAAAIPVTRPGLAYLLRGNEAPEQFQAAMITPPGPDTEGSPTVMEAMEYLHRPRPGPAPGASAGPTPSQSLAAPQARELAQLREAVNVAWEATGSGKPRRPVAEPLPLKLPFPADGTTNRVRLGLLDLPGEQRTAEFGWHPGTHGHLALVPAFNGGADTVLGLIVEQLLTAAEEAHLYLLDATGSFDRAGTYPTVGAVVGLPEPRRAARVLERIAQEMARRLGGGDRTADAPALVLALCGWGSWVAAFRSGPLAWAEDLVHDIVRDGGRVRIAVVVAGERELVTARFFAAVPNRIFLPSGATEEGRLAWPRLPAVKAVAGRVVVFGPICGAPSLSGHVGQLFEPLPAFLRGGPARSVRLRPFRVEPLPERVRVEEVRFRAGHNIPGRGGRSGEGTPPPSGSPPSGSPPSGSPPSGPPPSGQLCLGVEGDELLPAYVPMPVGAVLGVLGGTASGKTTLLSALPGLNPGRSWLRAPAARNPERWWSATYDAALAGTLDPAAVLLVDDVDLQSAETNNRLLLLSALGWRAVVAAGFGTGLRQRVPLMQNAVGQGRGVLIAPRSLADGDVFGVRFELEQNPPPGRAVLIAEGRTRALQLAFDPAAPGSG